jgi:hypothetical protein
MKTESELRAAEGVGWIGCDDLGEGCLGNVFDDLPAGCWMPTELVSAAVARWHDDRVTRSNVVWANRFRISWATPP